MAKLSEIEGIGAAYAAKLNEAGISTQADLLKECCEKKGRKEIASDSGISEKLVLNWVNRADLARIKGVSTQYADLLECAGVDTVPELAQRKPENLQIKMSEINADKKLVRKVPSVSQVQDWVAQAKQLPRLVSH
jgi:predicted flap endonuclease-1-like 5' DNA nuclease